ncbi:DUF885 domain-containing protein [Caenimonas aquaedulcis]|uniref:DUF885 domain-containing protein n=1 Tax=Caenimonas aquaedulcis TaxID=2793270 RepID=A0A931MGU4_9BURK|nr:DUF885 domain-containing protein [Caenimonas aquaedulcis]MBG9388308.1 DUF885 domain-containing protein [Caenimonas aquaedulcis]
MNNIRFNRRAVNAGLATSLLLGSTAWRGALAASPANASQRVLALADTYYEEGLALFPVGTTENVGDARYEGAFEIEIAPAHQARQKRLYERTLARLRAIDRSQLDADAGLTYDLLKYECEDRLSTLAVPWHLMPVGHVDAMPMKLSQWASGDAAQPMTTVANYDHFLARLKKLPAWIDQAIVNMRDGIARGITLPRELVERTLPQFDVLLPADPLQSPYLAATRSFPAEIPPAQQRRIAAAYRAVVSGSVTPAVRKLRAFMADTYLPAARTTAGMGDMPGGADWYRLQVRSFTTTSMTPQEIHELGLKEVARIRAEMEQVKAKFGFEGPLDEFFRSLDGRPELQPFRSEEEVLAAYRAINERVKPGLAKLFERAPKAALEIKAIEPIRRATASDNYVPPASDGSRPGVFYAVVNDPKEYRKTTMTALFLHEGQPGHHYQIGMQREQGGSRYRQTTWYDAYGEGWALYAESLGYELGVYDDPVAQLGRLFMELHRALRLVVDTGLHSKGWSREYTIAYLREKEGSTEDSARRATERYMAWPGQALAYKVGELKILQLRERARQALGPKFDIRRFHSQVLGDGCMPLSMLEARIDRWIAATR